MKTRKSDKSTSAIICSLKARRQINSKEKKSRSTKRVSTKGSYPFWTAKEHRACMEAVQKHGGNYTRIAKAVKTRNCGQIRRRLLLLLKQSKLDKNYPDRHSLRPYEKYEK